MLELKNRLRCKPFQWFMDHVDRGQPLRSLDDIEMAGEIRNQENDNICIDTLSHRLANEEYGAFFCHGGGGTQGFFRSR